MNCVNGKTRNECFKTTSYSPTPAFGFSRIFHAILPIRYKIETSTQGGPVAQRLEQRTHNPLVPGSNPGGPTNIPKDLACFSVFVNFSIVGTFVGTQVHLCMGFVFRRIRIRTMWQTNLTANCMEK